MPTFSSLENFVDTINANLTKPRRWVNGSEGVTIDDIKQALIDCATFASELTANGSGKANIAGAEFTGQVTAPMLAIGTTVLNSGNEFQVNFVSALAQKPYLAANVTGDNPYFEFQRFSGTGVTFWGSRINQRNARFAIDVVSTAAAIGSQTFLEALCIDSNLRVGIGVASPARRLDVQDNLTSSVNFSNIIARFSSNANGADATIQFADNFGATAHVAMKAGALMFGTNGTSLRFNISSGGVGHFASRLHINTGSDFTDQLVPLFVNGNGQVAGIMTIQKLAGGSSTPSISAGTGAGTSPTVSIVGKDTAGQITITTGSSPAANATIVTITFASAYVSAPFVNLTPANANASALALASRPFPGSSTISFVLTAGTTALTAATQYIFNYHVIQ